jgi:hypothetical protein
MLFAPPSKRLRIRPALPHARLLLASRARTMKYTGETTMTAKKKMMPPTWLEDEQSVGFRIGADGEIELMTRAETEAVVERAIREGMYRAGWPRPNRTLH